MKSLYCSLLLIAALVLPGLVSAKTANRTILRVATHDLVAPLVMPDRRTGLEVDIVREALQLEGFDIVLTFLPALRMQDALTQGKVDAAFPLRTGAVPENIYLTDSHITFRNVAVSLEETNATIRRAADLGNYTVNAFLGASKWLPEDYRAMAQTNPGYSEQSDQQAQVCSFFARRDRVIVLEQLIFDYYAANGCNPHKLPYAIHDILEPAHVRVAFTDKALRDAFNRGLQKLNKSGRYDAIMRQYLGPKQ